MFAEIAPRYDFLNHLLSLNFDRRWRHFTVAKLTPHLERDRAQVVDLCCGTADLALDLGAFAPTIGVDFCHPMLKIGMEKATASRRPIDLVEGDALRVPLPDESFDVATMAFGLRNLEYPEAGLKEMHRLLKPGGRAAILEFSRPRVAVFRRLFGVYFSRVLPVIGGTVSGSHDAYRYLPASVRSFFDQEELADLMSRVGFCEVRYYNLFGGVAALHLGDKEPALTAYGRFD
jgi:demethylmenaquinone methyltransferase/2-methoxy-6-polyprenyl-1,4-benzoquinol methylase